MTRAGVDPFCCYLYMCHDVCGCGCACRSSRHQSFVLYDVLRLWVLRHQQSCKYCVCLWPISVLAVRMDGGMQTPGTTVAFTALSAVCIPSLVPCLLLCVQQCARQRYHHRSHVTCQMCGCRYWRAVECRLIRYISAS